MESSCRSARTADAIAAGRFDPPCPRCGGDLAPEPVPEDAPTDPRSVYAATKLHQEHLCVLFGRDHDLPVTALRYHNIYGPRMPANTPYAGVASIFLSALAAGRAPQVLEDGRQLRDFVHVDDVARANLLALTTTTPYDGPLNIASGNPQTVGELAHRLWLATGAATPPAVAVGGSRPGDVRHVFASADGATRTWISWPQFRSSRASNNSPRRRCANRSPPRETAIEHVSAWAARRQPRAWTSWETHPACRARRCRKALANPLLIRGGEAHGFGVSLMDSGACERPGQGHCSSLDRTWRTGRSRLRIRRLGVRIPPSAGEVLVSLVELTALRLPANSRQSDRCPVRGSPKCDFGKVGLAHLAESAAPLRRQGI